MKRIIVLFSALMLSGILASAQDHSVKGRVTGPDGNSLPGITVQVKGSNTATATDSKGQFELTLPSNSTLVFTGVGFVERSVKVGTNSSLDVTLASTTTRLNEVVVTALGIQRTRNSLPYAAQQISGDDVNKTVTTNVVDNLSGKIAGLQITSSNAMGGSTNAVLRGFKSLTQSNQALFIIDGVPYNNSSITGNGIDFGSATSDINPDDIASISVLKGAAASALYGSRASNGVILITTKKGYNRKGVGVTASFGVSAGSPDKSTLPVYQTQYGEGYGSLGNYSGGGTPTGQNPFFLYFPIPGVNGGNVVPIVQTAFDAATGPAYDPSEMVYNWESFSPTDPNFHKPSPWEPAANHNPTDYFVTPVTTTESVLVQGGGDQGTFKFNYTRDDEKGYIPNSSITKNMFDFGATRNITKRLSVDAALNYVNENAKNRYIYQYTGGTNPMTDFRQWWPTNVDLKALKNDYFNSLTNATWNWQTGAYGSNALGNIGLPAYHDNPYWFAYQNYEADSRDRYTGHAKANYKITDYLNLSAGVTDDYYNQFIEQRNNIGSQATPYYTRQNISFNESNLNFLLNFNKNIGNNLNVKALVGGNVAKDQYTSIFASTNGGLLVPSYWSVSNSVSTPEAPTEVDEHKEVDGLFAGATLSFKDMVTLDGTIRRDKSSTLPSANNTYYYPSVSANFVFSKMLPSLQNWLSYGKVWVNYAEVGGDAPYYLVYNNYSINTPLNGQAIMNINTTNNNQNLVPEENKTYEAGLEMSFLNNRLGFTADYYHSVQSEEILPINVSTATGFNKFSVNGGSVQNQGVELTANITPIKTNNFSWNMTVNWTKNENKVLSLYGGQPSYEIAGLQNSIQIVAEVGKSYGIIRGTDYTYLNGQKVVDATGHYILSSNPLSDIGSVAPKWIGGLNNSFTYKNFTLSFLIDVQHGGQVYSLDMDYGSSSGIYPRNAGFNKNGKSIRAPLSDGGGYLQPGVTADGKPNSVLVDESDILLGNYTFSSAYGEATSQFIYNASYVKLREASLSYSLPKKLIEKTHFLQGIDLALSGRNLWIIHKFLPYADPEQGQAAGNASIGFQNGAYPTYRMMNFIIKANF